MELSYDAVCFDLFGTLVDEHGVAIARAREALDIVPSARCAIVTSCGARFARHLLNAAQLQIPPILVTSDDVERGKPSPDGYRLAAARLGFAPAGILVLEDSRAGIAAARAAGMDVIGIVANRAPSYEKETVCTLKRLADISWSVLPGGTISVNLPAR